MKHSLPKYVFWLSFFGGIPFLLRLSSFQSLNIASIPALIDTVRYGSIRLALDCKIFFAAWVWHVFYSLYYLSADSILSIAQFTSVFLVYISLRKSLYFPGHRGISYFLIASFCIGFIQTLFDGVSSRGVAMIASEPSRFARSLAVLVLPFIVHFKRIKDEVYFLLPVLGAILLFNRSASLGLIGLWIFVFLADQIFSVLLVKLQRFRVPVNKLMLGLSIFLALIPVLLWLVFENTRLGQVVSRLINALLYNSSDIIDVLYGVTGRRLQTVVASFQQASFSWPRGVKGYSMFLNEESFSRLGIFLSNYQSEKLAMRENFESSSFISSFVVQGGFVSLIISSILCIIIIASVFRLRKFFATSQSIMRSVYISSSTVALFQIILYSNDSILQPWVMLALALNFGDLVKKKNLSLVAR